MKKSMNRMVSFFHRLTCTWCRAPYSNLGAIRIFLYNIIEFFVVFTCSRCFPQLFLCVSSFFTVKASKILFCVLCMQNSFCVWGQYIGNLQGLEQYNELHDKSFDLHSHLSSIWMNIQFLQFEIKHGSFIPRSQMNGF